MDLDVKGDSTQHVVEASEGEDESSQFAELKTIQLALQIAELTKRPVYTDSWVVANTLWGWLQQWKTSWQSRGKLIWPAALWQDVVAQVENIFLKDCLGDACMPQSRTAKEHQNNEQVDKAVKIEVVQVDWESQGEPFVGQWAYETLGHLGRDATHRWACD